MALIPCYECQQPISDELMCMNPPGCCPHCGAPQDPRLAADHRAAAFRERMDTALRLCRRCHGSCKCPVCQGTGKEWSVHVFLPDHQVPCRTCYGRDGSGLCWACGGTGRELPEDVCSFCCGNSQCQKCKGAGEITEYGRFWNSKKACEECQGSGQCRWCKATGKKIKKG